MRNIEKFYYRVKVADSLESIANNHNISIGDITRNNPDIPLYAGEIIRIEKKDYLIHVVKPMDTLDMISSRYGVGVDIIKQNNMLTSDKLFIGQELKIYK